MTSPDGRALLRSSTTVVWVALVAATCVSWWLGASGGVAADPHVGASVAVLVVAFVKVRLVGIHFMELGRAPLALRAAFEAYVILVGGALVVLYLVG
jgi:hypothetical protein